MLNCRLGLTTKDVQNRTECQKETEKKTMLIKNKQNWTFFFFFYKLSALY